MALESRRRNLHAGEILQLAARLPATVGTGGVRMEAFRTERGVLAFQIRCRVQRETAVAALAAAETAPFDPDRTKARPSNSAKTGAYIVSERKLQPVEFSSLNRIFACGCVRNPLDSPGIRRLFQNLRRISACGRSFLGSTDIGAIELDAKSRDDIPAQLIGLQAIYMNEETRTELFRLLDAHVLPGRRRTTGRPGMDLWRILAVGVLK